ncbi:MAG: CbtB domain-containing protein [bacterium]
MIPAPSPAHAGASNSLSPAKAGDSNSLSPAIAATPGARSGVRVPSRVAIATVGALMGLLLLFGAGFANSQVLHEAAHDARHGLGFPCH